MSNLCCAVSRASNPKQSSEQKPFITNKTAPSTSGMVRLDGGAFLMGSNDSTFPSDGEGPVREVTLKPFWMDETAVTNTQFAKFVAQTGYVTEAERYGWSYVFYQFLPAELEKATAVPSAPWWRQVYGATWQHPEGPHSNIDKRGDHPVVHVSWHDATAYAAWCGKRLPTEAEWEYAARGGLRQKQFPWGDVLHPNGKHQCNIWQGKFPQKNTQRDGHLGTCEARAFRPNRYGLYNMSGNVWEWCADWFHPTFRQLDLTTNPQGPPSGTAKVVKGGSYLCHKSYCNRYRVSARTHNTPDSTTGHMGFRCVYQPQ